MQYRRLGRTGLRVSLLGLGTGGANRLGQSRGADPDAVRAFVRAALDLGVNYFDTAEVYRSEEPLANALREVPRSGYVLATKYRPTDAFGAVLPAEAVDLALRERLRLLRTDVIDVIQVHALTTATYDEVIERHLPVLFRARELGLVRGIGVTESFAGDDPSHAMLVRALRDDHFDVVMVGYNLLHQSAEREVLPLAAAADVGVIVMAAVRRALATPEALEAQVRELKRDALIAPDAVPDTDPLGWLVEDGAASVQAAAYQFTAQPAAVSTVLTGTFDVGHLRENAAAVDAGALPAADSARLHRAFGHLDLGLGR